MQEQEVIDGATGEIVPVRTYNVASESSGLVALGHMSEREFEERLQVLRLTEARVRKIFEAVLTRGEDESSDLMQRAGIAKPFLTQNGANRTKQLLGLVAIPGEARAVAGDGVTQPPLAVRVRVDLHVGDAGGPVIGSAWGVCNVWEEKYRYRTADYTCPECEKQAIIKGKVEYGGGWVCFRKKGGCGAKWADGDNDIEGQVTGRIENPDPWDLEETLTRIAEKRADVAAVCRYTGLKRYVSIDDDAAVWDRIAAKAAPAAEPEPPTPPEQPRRSTDKGPSRETQRAVRAGRDAEKQKPEPEPKVPAPGVGPAISDAVTPATLALLERLLGMTLADGIHIVPPYVREPLRRAIAERRLTEARARESIKGLEAGIDTGNWPDPPAKKEAAKT